MTNREFFTAVIANSISEDVITKAQEMLQAMDAKNEKRRNQPSKTAIANEPVKKAIVEYLNGKENVIASEVGKSLNITTQKASILLGQLQADEVVKVSEVKVKGKGKVKGYTLQ